MAKINYYPYFINLEVFISKKKYLSRLKKLRITYNQEWDECSVFGFHRRVSVKGQNYSFICVIEDKEMSFFTHLDTVIHETFHAWQAHRDVIFANDRNSIGYETEAIMVSNLTTEAIRQFMSLVKSKSSK